MTLCINKNIDYFCSLENCKWTFKKITVFSLIKGIFKDFDYCTKTLFFLDLWHTPSHAVLHSGLPSSSPNNTLWCSSTWERRVSFIYQAKLKPARCFRPSGFACPTLVSFEPQWCHNTGQGNDFTAPVLSSEHIILCSQGKSYDSRTLQECLMDY